jgi:hypothetical protein
MDGQSRHSFETIDLFDGPPQDEASLIPAETGYGIMWAVSPQKSDIYMVCGYEGRKKTITVHAPSVSICKGINTPAAGYCE